MSPRLKISNLVIERLKSLQDVSSGQLFGVNDDKSVFIVGFSVSPNAKDSDEKENGDNVEDLNNYDIVSNLPGGVDVCGTFQVLSGEVNLNPGNELLDKVKKIPVVITVDSSSKNVSSYLYIDSQAKKEEHTIFDEKDISKLFLHLRLIATIPVACDFQYESVQQSISVIQQKIAAGNGAFQFEGSNIFILNNNPDGVSGISSGSTMEEVFSALKMSKDENRITVANVNMCLKTTNNETSTQLAPLIKYVKKEFKHASIDLSIDSLVMVPKTLKVKELYPLLVESVSRNLILNKNSLLSQLKSDGSDVSLPRTYHFRPQPIGHFISITYPSKKTLEQLRKCRENYHVLLSLPLDKPLFRQGNAFDFSNKPIKNDKILLNPHEGLGLSGIVGGEPCFVQGLYAYHHYMQDNFDDSGWGCAYRSLQTVFSWFRLQGYTTMPIPTHEEIQKCLVDIGDKMPSFVGSNQWIGSTEVSFVLDTMLGVTCRISSVSSGEEMTMKGGELSYHFKTQGTPVMIGGGVLAHTIIGVDYNKKTGDIKFLILDPHYTGGEDLNVIQSKGWCGWKGPDFWKKNAFYNMCMPLKPKCV